ncbi:MAG: hypothetical protein MPI95_03960 [Nitrosopumilus sp.]|nr:hypothetical protein [Nitrosopumilus sp.]CAI9832380.1 exported hypothetical protein [Nitrosopumilaceae archaeon]MDA7941732.1 hypothetical protein [Nitrosopumilus sp.]MDA7943733.1 hypothetical protein [Nitrosopumilus sp.]MDA7945429.1 hypothetical protein [Nitrosopumilus sp.]
MNRLLVFSAVGAALVLAGITYQSAHHAERQAGGGTYAFIAGIEPLFEPRLQEPLLYPPRLGYWGDTWGYSAAVHNPADDSVTFWYERERVIRPGGIGYTIPKTWELPHDSYSQTYGVNQTFAYRCLVRDDARILHMYQYRGTSLFQGNLSLVLVHFELEVPPDTPCEYPDLLRQTVDVYDAGGFDGMYGLGQYREDPHAPYDPYADPVRHAVLLNKVYVDPFPLDRPLFGPDLPVLNPDGSVTVTHARAAGDGITSHTRTYMPGQTFVDGCEEGDGTTFLSMYNYRGAEVIPWYSSDPALIFANWGAYTRAPMPCTFPDYIEMTVDAFDPSRLDRQWDTESYRDEPDI